MKNIILPFVMFFCCLPIIKAQPGSLDSSFGNNGIVKTDIAYTTPAFQKDGKIVVTGFKSNGKDLDFLIARYNTDGTIDSTFSFDGYQTTDFGRVDFATALALQSDGKIVVVGNTGKTYTDSVFFAIARYNTNGSLDKTFGNDGMQKMDFYNNGKNYSSSVAIQGGDKIVVVGTATSPDNYYESNAVVIRYNVDGSLDTTFDEDGKQTMVFNQSDGGDNYYGALQGSATSVALQGDGKILVNAIMPSDFAATDLAVIVRVNADGSMDKTFGVNGTSQLFDDANTCKIANQSDGKIVFSGFSHYRGYSREFMMRFNSDGNHDISALTEYDGSWFDGVPYYSNFIAGQSKGKVVSGGISLHVYNLNGTSDSTFKGNEQKLEDNEDWKGVHHVAIDGRKLYTISSDKIARFFLDDKSEGKSPTVSITTPANNTTYLAPAAHIKLSASAADGDGSISKVGFYKGNTLLHTETVAPYGFIWRDVPFGNYTLTAKATDNSGLVTTSDAVHISIVPNKLPTVSIIGPSNNKHYAAPAYIHLEAAASDTDGRITRVEFYNGSTLLRTEYKYPYTYVWKNVPAGTYTITAVATDNWGAQTTSEPIVVKVKLETEATVSKRASVSNKKNLSDVESLKLYPNPTNQTLNIYTKGLQQNKQFTISIISASGFVLKKMQISSSTQSIQLNVSSLLKGVYTIKVISVEKVLYKKFVKL